MGWLITRDPNGGFTRVFAHGLGLPLMDVVLDLRNINSIDNHKSKRKAGNPRQGRGLYISDENKERRENMIAMRDSGMTLSQIGEAHNGLSRERVRQIIGNTGHKAGEIREADISETLLSIPEMTNSEIQQVFNISKSRISKTRSKTRHAIEKDSSPGVGAKWEEWVSGELNKHGINNELMPYGHPFDILTESGIRIDVKFSNTRADFMASSGCVSPTYHFSIQNRNSDFFIFVADEQVFVIPVSELPKKSTTIRIVYPPMGKKKLVKYAKYKDRWDLLVPTP